MEPACRDVKRADLNLAFEHHALLVDREAMRG
jgi:hypothetical protein